MMIDYTIPAATAVGKERGLDPLGNVFYSFFIGKMKSAAGLRQEAVYDL